MHAFNRSSHVRVAAAAAIVLAAGLACPALAVDKSWELQLGVVDGRRLLALAGSLVGDVVHVVNMPGVQNNTVRPDENNDARRPPR